jgi:molybdate/tungstate transport system substrate-binding protein
MIQNPGSKRLLILHAGSLSGAFSELNREFQRLYPAIEISDEPGGSASLVRDVIKGKTCSILASADYNLIVKMMLPDYADWCILFAANQMVLRYSNESPYAAQINDRNWPDILQKDEVFLWHPDADGDPGGYRALMVLQLAEKYFKVPGFYQKIMDSHSKILDRSHFQDSKSGYMFSYGIPPAGSGMKYILLPDEINLSNSRYKDYYAQAVVMISGVKDGESITLHGEPILFGVTIHRSSVNQALAVEWLHLLLSATGVTPLEKIGMKPLKPVVIGKSGKVPEKLQKYFKLIT